MHPTVPSETSPIPFRAKFLAPRSPDTDEVEQPRYAEDSFAKSSSAANRGHGLTLPQQRGVATPHHQGALASVAAAPQAGSGPTLDAANPLADKPTGSLLQREMQAAAQQMKFLIQQYKAAIDNHNAQPGVKRVSGVLWTDSFKWVFGERFGLRKPANSKPGAQNLERIFALKERVQALLMANEKLFKADLDAYRDAGLPSGKSGAGPLSLDDDLGYFIALPGGEGWDHAEISYSSLTLSQYQMRVAAEELSFLIQQYEADVAAHNAQPNFVKVPNVKREALFKLVFARNAGIKRLREGAKNRAGAESVEALCAKKEAIWDLYEANKRIFDRSPSDYRAAGLPAAQSGRGRVAGPLTPDDRLIAFIALH